MFNSIFKWKIIWFYLHLYLHTRFVYTKFMPSSATNNLCNYRVPTVLEKSLNFGFSLKSPWKWIHPWKVLEFRGPSLKFQVVVLDFLFCVFWTESLNGYSKLRGTRANFPPKKFVLLCSQQLTSWIFFQFLLLIYNYRTIVIISFISQVSYMYLCILCVSMYQSVSKWTVSTLIVA